MCNFSKIKDCTLEKHLTNNCHEVHHTNNKVSKVSLMHVTLTNRQFIKIYTDSFKLITQWLV